MDSAAAELLTPRIAVVDDEPQIHASLRLRLGKSYELTSFHDARSALDAVGQGNFDLCLVDIHMPDMDGFAFIEAAALVNPPLGFVVLSAFDSEENLRRTIPLNVYDFISKPLPERDGFEARIPDWIARTRQRRRDRTLALQAGTIDHDLDTALIERDVELVASESARDALMEAANLLTTIHAHFVTATAQVAARTKSDPSLVPLLRNLEVGRKTAEAAAAVTEGFFDSSYGSRHSSPALVDTGIYHALAIASRLAHAEEAGKAVDFEPADNRLPIHDLSGIDFLLMLVPAIGLALAIAPPNSTVRIRCAAAPRLDLAAKDSRFQHFHWLNRRAATTSRPGFIVSLFADAPPPPRAVVNAWLNGQTRPYSHVTAHGLIKGLQKCKGMLGLALPDHATQFQLLLALPT